jgi:hypothetical protein
MALTDEGICVGMQPILEYDPGVGVWLAFAPFDPCERREADPQEGSKATKAQAVLSPFLDHLLSHIFPC